MSIQDHIPPAQGSRWLYTGPGHGTGSLHSVVSTTAEGGDWDRGEVAMWSDPVLGDEAIAGWSWLGSLADFVRFFRPLATT